MSTKQLYSPTRDAQAQVRGQGQPEGRQHLPSEDLPPNSVFYPPSPPGGGRTSGHPRGHPDTTMRTGSQAYDGTTGAHGASPGMHGSAAANSGLMGQGPNTNNSYNADPFSPNGAYDPSANANGASDHLKPPPPSSQARHHPHRSPMQETDEELTEDELVEYEKGLLTWDKAKSWRFWFRKEWAWWYVIFLVLVILVALMAFFHHSIIDWLSPFVKRLRTLKAGFVIPAVILFVLSFPPLFGNEIVIVLVGLVWGLGKGFAIVVVGLCLGEIAVFLTFRYLCHARAERMTRKSLNYACLSEAIREGGYVMAFVVRLSVIPTHFTTAVFAVCGLKFWQYCIALIGGLPKQLIGVYVGVVLGQTNASTNSHVISDCVFAACAIITLGALWFIYKRMIRVRKRVLISMRDDLKRHGVQVGDVPENIANEHEQERVGGGHAHVAQGREWDRLRSMESPRGASAVDGQGQRQGKV